MRSRSTLILRAAFSTAILAACRDKTETPPPPEPTATTATPTGTAAATTTATTHASSRPTDLGPGQRCAGALVPALKPATPVDYLELRLDYYRGMPEEHQVVSTGQTGKPCATANDVPKCTAALDAAIPKGTSGGEYLVYTRGDEVGTVRGKEIVAFLAPIDSVEEAAIATVYPMTEGTSASAVLVGCDPAKYTKTAAGFETTYVRSSFCDERHETTYVIDKDGTVKTTKQVDTPPKPGCHPPFLGRRPEGLELTFSEEGEGARSCGQFFAECTEMEAASVASFRRLDGELRALGAPTHLRRRARRAAGDEARHARSMRSLARRFGREPGKPNVARARPRSALAMAIDNAENGCVVETWAALVATWQATHAEDATVRATLATVARDETRHAALARDVARWLDAKLTAAEREVVAEAKRTAIANLERTITASAAATSPELARVAGMPNASQVARLFAQIQPNME